MVIQTSEKGPLSTSVAICCTPAFPVYNLPKDIHTFKSYLNQSIQSKLSHIYNSQWHDKLEVFL